MPILLSKMYNLNPIMRKHEAILKLRNFLTNKWPVFFKNASVKKDEKMKNCSRLMGD